MTAYERIPLEVFDTDLRSGYVEVSSSALGGEVLSCSDDFFASKDNLIKPTPSASMKGLFGPNGALYDGWESRRHNPEYDWVIIKLAAGSSQIHYVNIDTSHFSGNEAPASQVFGLKISSESTKETKLRPNDSRWQELLPVVELGPNSRHIFKLGKTASEGTWSALMVRMIPDGGMARFRAFGVPLPPTLYTSIPDPSTPTINLLDPLIGARIISCSDANFSPPGNLLLPGRGVDMSDGWETRRSQEARGKYAPNGPLAGQERKEWVVAALATTGVVRCVEVDTAFHPGNYPTACMVEATLCNENTPPSDAKWTPIVLKKPLGPHRQHWFDVERSVPADQVFSHVRLNTYPDGGLKRLRIYGYPIAPDAAEASNLDEVITIPALPLTVETFKPYGDVIQGYGLPTSAPKGIDVSIANQGTAYKFHRLAKVTETYSPGMLHRGGLAIGAVRAMPHYATKDGLTITVKQLERHLHTTQAFIPIGKGTNPDVEALPPGGAFIAVVALNGKDDKPDVSTLRAFLCTAAQGVSYNEGTWHHGLLTVDAPLDYIIVEAQVGDPGLIIDCETWAPEKPYCKIEVPPYTGVPPPTPRSIKPNTSQANGHHHHHPSAIEALSHYIPHIPTSIEEFAHIDDGIVHPIPITPEAWAPDGNLILAYPDPSKRHSNMDVQGSLVTGKTEKYSRLAPILHTYPKEEHAVTSIGVYRSTKKVGLERGKVFDVRLMERHPYTTQAFIPMGKAQWDGHGEEALPPGGSFLVVVAKNGPDDRPDPSTLKSFIMESANGLSYAAGTWHHPVLVLDSTLDLACVETQLHTGVRDSDPRDCELLQWNGEEVFGRIAVPKL